MAKNTLTKCKKCESGWEIKAEENYCGWCGAEKVSFEVEPNENNPQLIYNENNDAIELKFNVYNLSSEDINVKISYELE